MKGSKRLRKKRKRKEQRRQELERQAAPVLAIVRPDPKGETEEDHDQAEWDEWALELEQRIAAASPLKHAVVKEELAHSYVVLRRVRDSQERRVMGGRANSEDRKSVKGYCSEMRRTLEDMGVRILEEEEEEDFFGME